MESLVTELVWLVTNYQARVVGVLLFWGSSRLVPPLLVLRDPCAVQGRRYTPPPLDAKTF